MKNLLLYLSAKPENELPAHISYQIEQIRSTFDELIFSVKSQENEAQAWSQALQEIGFDKLPEYNSVALMNYSTFGPITDFQAVFDKMQARENDFWGLTNLRAENAVAEIQPYFMTFKNALLSSPVFQEFWTKTPEAAMTATFEQAGFKSDVLFDTQNADTKEMLGVDFANYNLSAMLEHGVPFLKIEAFAIAALNSTLPATMEYIKQISTYPTALITDYMTWLDYPDRPYMLNDKLIQISDQPVPTTAQTVGIHLHVFYKDLLPHFVKLFDQFVKNYDLYITTDTDESKSEIEQTLAGNAHLQEIMVVGKKGRDVLPWMKIHEKLSKYDIAGHFHTKKSAENLWIVGESWRTDIEKQLIEPAQQLFAEFANNPKIGIIIPEVPAYYQSNFGPLPMDEAQMWDHMAKMWINIDFKNQKGLRTQDFYMMSYGTMAWYRPKALDNLLAVDIENDIPDEPLQKNSVLHAFERLLVYVAWGNDFDFRIAHKETFNGFWANRAPSLAIDEMLSSDTALNSWEYLLAHAKSDKETWEYILSQVQGKKAWQVLLNQDNDVWDFLNQEENQAWRFLSFKSLVKFTWAKFKFIIKRKLGRH